MYYLPLILKGLSHILYTNHLKSKYFRFCSLPLLQSFTVQCSTTGQGIIYLLSPQNVYIFKTAAFALLVFYCNIRYSSAFIFKAMRQRKIILPKGRHAYAASRKIHTRAYAWSTNASFAMARQGRLSNH